MSAYDPLKFVTASELNALSSNPQATIKKASNELLMKYSSAITLMASNPAFRGNPPRQLKEFDKLIKNEMFVRQEKKRLEQEKQAEAERQRKSQDQSIGSTPPEANTNPTGAGGSGNSILDRARQLIERKKEEEQPKPKNYTPYYIGGAIILLVIIGFIAFRKSR